MPEPFISKKTFKRRAGACQICGEKDQDLLDTHRWYKEGKDGGKYTSDNCVCVCSLCHRKLHSKKIKIIGIFMSTCGYVLNYIDENGQEQFNKI
jgi:5-methylcytosine-specific restriction endonuclease McrA